MQIRNSSLFTNISAAFAFIILMSFFLSISLEYYNTTRNLPVLLTEVQTGYFANSLSLLYSRQGNWENLAKTVRDLTTTMPEFDDGKALRVIVEDNTGKTLYNSFTDMLNSSGSNLIEGKSGKLIDYINGMAVGKIVLYVDEDYLKLKTLEYLLIALKEKLILTLGAVLIALIPASLLSRLITSPLRRLSKASQEIRSGNIVQIPENYSTKDFRELSKSFNRMAATLKKQKELRQRLTGDISHEINTPLNIIDLEARGIEDGLISPGKGLKSIRTEIEKLSNLIKDLDWLAETDAGEFSLNRQFCLLSPIIEEEIDRWQFKARKAGISLIYENEADIPLRLSVDPFRIKQALGNLLENSLKYAPESKEIKVNVSIENKSVQISVTDQGRGIADDQKTEIFERLYRVEDSRNSGTGGRGLGLSICKTIVELHNGRIEVVSEIGRGSSFIITLPL